MHQWPDDRRILSAVLEPFGSTTYSLEPGFTELLAAGETAPIIHLTRAGGTGETQDGVERVRRIKVEVYAVGESTAEDLAEAISTYLVGRFHYDPANEDMGLIDTVVTESVPTPVPYPDDVISLVSALYRTVCRPL